MLDIDNKIKLELYIKYFFHGSTEVHIYKDRIPVYMFANSILTPDDEIFLAEDEYNRQKIKELKNLGLDIFISSTSYNMIKSININHTPEEVFSILKLYRKI